MNNSDMIRRMTDEELVDFLCYFDACLYCMNARVEDCESGHPEVCKDGVLKYLKTDVSDESIAVRCEIDDEAIQRARDDDYAEF